MDFVGLLAKAMACNGHHCRWRTAERFGFHQTGQSLWRQRKPTFHELSLKFVCSSDSSIYVQFMYIILSLLSKLYIRIAPFVLVSPRSFRSLIRPPEIPQPPNKQTTMSSMPSGKELLQLHQLFHEGGKMTADASVFQIGHGQLIVIWNTLWNHSHSYRVPVEALPMCQSYSHGSNQCGGGWWRYCWCGVLVFWRLEHIGT